MAQSAILSQIHGEKCWPSVDKLSPCEVACPLHTDVPSYVMAIAQGRFKEALDVIRDTNPLPAICGRVCHHPCEEECNRLLVDKPVAVEWLKRFAVDYGGDRKPRMARKSTKEKVAVIGSGPAGLTAAHDLARKGYRVTIYEALPFPGGMLTAGIPGFVLPRRAIQQDIEHIESLGVRIKTGKRLGEDFSLDDLSRMGFKAVLLATGAHRSARLDIPGADLKNVRYALPLLQSINLGEEASLKGRVVVIGGGNVAMDIARMALRLGAAEVRLACLESRRKMPAYAWETEAARREGVKIHPALAPQSFAGEGGKVGAVEFQRVASTRLDREGRISWTLKEGDENRVTMPADTVIIAIGQACDSTCLGNDQLKVGRRGTILTDSDTLETSLPGVFAAGDAVSFPGTVTDSMAAGRTAAASIDAYLSNGKRGKQQPQKEAIQIEAENIPDWFTRKPRWEIPRLAPGDAARCLEEVDLAYTPWQAVEEAKRCLNCRMCANCIFDHDQLCFETGTRLLR